MMQKLVKSLAKSSKLTRISLQDFQQLFAHKVLINEMKHHETKDLLALYLDTYTHATDAVFKRQLAAALAYSKDADNIQTLIAAWKDKFVVKPQDLSAWYYQFLAHQATQETAWSWARENWAWIKAALGGDMSFDSFVILPAHVFKTQQRFGRVQGIL